MSELEDGNYIITDHINLFSQISETRVLYFIVSFIPHLGAELIISVSKHHYTGIIV